MTTDGVRMRRLTETATAIVGPRAAVRAQLELIEAQGWPVRYEKPQPVAGQPGQVVTVVTLVTGEQTPPAPMPWWRRPGPVCAVLLSAAALVAAVGYVVWLLVSVVVAYGLIILGVGAAVGVVVLTARGDRFTQVMNITRR